MNKLIKTSPVDTAVKINEIIDELEKDVVTDIVHGSSENKIVVQKKNGSNSEIVIDNVENANRAVYATMDDDGNVIKTSYLKKIDGIIQGDMNISGNYKVNGKLINEALNLLKRNAEYIVGDIAFDKRLKSYIHLECIREGRSGESDFEESFYKALDVGSEFEDGEVLWKAVKFITKSNISVSATDRADQIKVSDNGRESVITINNVENALKVNGHSVEADVPKNAVFTDTVYFNATTQSDGLLSSEDKAKLDTIGKGANKVSFTRTLNSGVKIGTITIEGNNTDLFSDTNITVKKMNFALNELSKHPNGYFAFNGTIEGVSGNWIILKTNSLYQATNIENPRIVISSSNLTTWYSPYAYWHA